MTSTTEHRPAPSEFRAADKGSTPRYVHVISAGIALQFVSGHSSQFGLPLPVDRLVLLIGVIMFLAHADRRKSQWSVRPIHLILAAAASWTLFSMFMSGTVRSSAAVFGFVDSFGLIPFALFCIAPVVYSDPARRHSLLVALTTLGAYLGLVSVLQGFRLEQFIFPRYIVDPSSAHFGRAFGPSLQAGSNGMQLFACMACSAILSRRSRGLTAVLCRVVAASCAIGLFFTMTRAIWIGAALGIVLALWIDRRLRLRLAVGLAGIPLLGAGLLLASSGLRTMATERLNDAQSAFDRINAAAAALNALQAHPMLGIGYYNFANVEDTWFWQLQNTPVAATGIAVHNVFLGYAVEIGLPGLTLMALGLIVASKGMLRPLPADDETLMWRQAAIGYVACWICAAMLMPITYALPSTLLWLFLAMVSRPGDLGWSRKAQVVG